MRRHSRAESNERRRCDVDNGRGIHGRAMLYIDAAFPRGWRIAAGVPLAGMIPVLVLTFHAYEEQSNLWPILLLFASPPALFYLIVLTAARRSGTGLFKSAPPKSGGRTAPWVVCVAKDPSPEEPLKGGLNSGADNFQVSILGISWPFRAWNFGRCRLPGIARGRCPGLQ